jgi:hypothetical protein
MFDAIETCINSCRSNGGHAGPGAVYLVTMKAGEEGLRACGWLVA